MHKKPPPLSPAAKILKEFCERNPAFTRPDGGLRHSAIADDMERMLGKMLALKQPTITRLLHGNAAGPKAEKAIAAYTGRSIAEVQGDPQAAMNLSFDARTVATKWDQLPQAAQVFLFEEIDKILAFQQAEPTLAKIMFAKPTGRAYSLHEKKIESWQDKYNKAHRK